MSLQDIYRRFLADPKSASLAPDVSLIYITTTTRFDQADAVQTHLARQQNIVKKKGDDILSAIEGPDSLCLDVETTLEFVSGGGAYLPSLDDNFLADRVATFPTLHIVRFNAQKQIQQVKLYWDQASLLKQIEVIGSRGRNWPIRDAKDQTRLIKSAALANPPDSAPASSAPSLPPTSSENKPDELTDRPPSPGKRHIKDPYAAGSLADLLSPGKDSIEPVHTPRAPASGQPAPRDLGELFVSHDDNDTPDASPSRKPIAPRAGGGHNYKPSRIFDDDETVAAENASARKVAPKAGAGHNYKPSRIFDDDETVAAETASAKKVAPKAGGGQNFRPSRIFDDDETVAAEEKKPAYRAHPNRYSHFEIGGDNSEREAKPLPSRPKSQHTAQWTFEDFVTPEKPTRKLRGQEIRHFGWSDDEGEVQPTPPARPHIPQPRRDAQSHIQLTDEMDGGAEENKKPASGINRNKATGFSQNPLYFEEDDVAANESDPKAPLSVVSNGANRKKDFDSHWSIGDASPDDGNENKKPQTQTQTQTQRSSTAVGTDRLKAVRMMEPSWENYDESPPQASSKVPTSRRAARSAIDRHWGFEDM